VLVDVRPQSEFNAAFVDGSVNVSLYRPIQGWGWADNLRRAAFAFFGSMGSELDPQWVSAVESQVRKGASLLFRARPPLSRIRSLTRVDVG
jgi:prepilin-type processing-associated H-X9-DG protein